MNIDRLIDWRQQVREAKDYALSDEIRDKLDAVHVFVYDTKEGQVVYHELGGTRKDLEDKLNREAKGEKIFNAWLFSHTR